VISTSCTADALAVVRELLVERGVDPEPARSAACPGCGQVLHVEQGELESRTGCLAFMLVGMGYQPTWFTSRRGEVVLRPGSQRQLSAASAAGS
jgi:hypothetical protein